VRRLPTGGALIQRTSLICLISNSCPSILFSLSIRPRFRVERVRLSQNSSLHPLFDEGYLAVDPRERKLVVSNQIRQELENGKEFYNLKGQVIREPRDLKMRPLFENLEAHAYNVFRVQLISCMK
jgi:hypothetical protein